jgi:hypothetical protein
MGSLAWGLQLSALSSVSVNVDSERVLFENTVLNTDFELTNAFVRYELQGARTELSAELGDTVVDQTGKSTGGSLAKFNLSRKLSSAARALSARLRHPTSRRATAGITRRWPGSISATARRWH